MVRCAGPAGRRREPWAATPRNPAHRRRRYRELQCAVPPERRNCSAVFGSHSRSRLWRQPQPFRPKWTAGARRRESRRSTEFPIVWRKLWTLDRICRHRSLSRARWKRRSPKAPILPRLGIVSEQHLRRPEDRVCVRATGPDQERNRAGPASYLAMAPFLPAATAISSSFPSGDLPHRRAPCPRRNSPPLAAHRYRHE